MRSTDWPTPTITGVRGSIWGGLRVVILGWSNAVQEKPGMAASASAYCAAASAVRTNLSNIVASTMRSSGASRVSIAAWIAAA